MGIKIQRASTHRERPDSALRTHYAVLGVPPASSFEKLKDTYYRLARTHHPDLHPGDAAAEERFKEITLAWGVLRDSKLRADYDAKLMLEGRLSCTACGGRGLRSGMVGRKFYKDVLCESCDGTGEK